MPGCLALPTSRAPWRARAVRAGLLALGAALWAPGVRAQVPTALPRVEWLQAELSPSVIARGPMAGLGYVDRILSQSLIPALGEYRHAVTLAPPARVLSELEHNPRVCSVAISRTPERLRRFVFSPPLFRFLPLGLVVRRIDLPALRGTLNERGEISLTRFFQTPETANLGVTRGRSHTARLDRLIEAYPDRVRSVSLTNASHSLLAMVAKRHGMDATLAYSFELSFFESQRAEFRDQLALLPLEELPDTQLAYLACAKSPVGEAVVQRVAQLLTDRRQRERIQGHFEVWLDAASRQRLAQLREKDPDGFWRE